jgi:hypothetical protein
VKDFAPNFGEEDDFGCCITATHRLTLPPSPENFDQISAPIPEIMDGSLYNV